MPASFIMQNHTFPFSIDSLPSPAMVAAADQIAAQFVALRDLPSCFSQAEGEHRQVTEIEMVVSLVERQLSKASYHLQRFVSVATEFQHAVISRQVASKEPSTVPFVTPAPNAIFFEFDAFILATRGILEEKINRRLSANLRHHRIRDYREISKTVVDRLLAPLLRLIRNEISHLNRFGTSIGSVARFDYTTDKWSVRFPCSYSINGKRAELGYIVEYTLVNLCHFLSALLPLLRDELLATFGPVSEVRFHVGQWVVLLPTLEVVAAQNEFLDDPNRS